MNSNNYFHGGDIDLGNWCFKIFCALLVISILFIIAKYMKRSENFYYPVRNLSVDLDNQSDIYTGGCSRLPQLPVTDAEIAELNPYSSLKYGRGNLSDIMYNSSISNIGVLQPNAYKSMEKGSVVQLKQNMDSEYFTDNNMFNFPDTPLYMQAESIPSQAEVEMAMAASPLSMSHDNLVMLAQKAQATANDINVPPLERERLMQQAQILHQKAEEAGAYQQIKDAGDIPKNTSTFNYHMQSSRLENSMRDTLR